MTYSALPIKTPEGAFVRPSFAGGLTAGTPLSLSLDSGSITGMVVNASSLTLGAGHYMISCSLGILRNSTDYTLTLDWMIRATGVQAGSKGGIDNSAEAVMGCDVANACLTVPIGQTVDIDVVITNNSNNAMTLEASYSYLLIWRTEI